MSAFGSNKKNRPFATRAARDQRPALRRKVLFEAMEPRLLLSASVDGAGVLHAALTTGDDNAMIEQVGAAAVNGSATIKLTINTVSTSYSGVRGIDLQALTGHDVITVSALDAAFTKGIEIYGNHSGAPDIGAGDLFTDSVEFSGNLHSRGGLIQVFAEAIKVDAGVTLNTIDSVSGAENDIVFRARRIVTADLVNLSPIYADVKSVDIDIGANAKLQAGSIYLIAQAEDRNLTAQIGAPPLINSLVIGPVTDKIGAFAALPFKLLIKESSANITLHDNAQLTGSGTIGVYATASANSTGVASSKLFSAGYAQATATATINLNTGAKIDAGAAVVVTSDAGATAKIGTTTSADASNGNGGVALSLAVAYGKVTSKTTLADGASIVAGKTANIRSLAELASEAGAEAAANPDGTAGLAFGVQLSDADVHTTVNGSVTALMHGASLVKIDIDPTVTTPNTPGYIDYVNNRIYVGDTSLVTEDTVVYDNRRGGSIGTTSLLTTNGLVDGKSYVVINVKDDLLTPLVDESKYIQLAINEQNAIDGIAIDLQNAGPSTYNNKKFFDATAVDGSKDTIKLDNPAGSGSGVEYATLGQSIELGQPVVYHQGTAPIAGLVDGKTYYIITGIDEFDLQGDSRFIKSQVVQLAETENEARAGVNIDIGGALAGATGYRFESKHVLDSGMATGVGILSNLDVEDKAAATAGLANDNPNEVALPNTLTQSALDSIYEKLTASYAAKAGSAGAGCASGGPNRGRTTSPPRPPGSRGPARRVVGSYGQNQHAGRVTMLIIRSDTAEIDSLLGGN